MNDENDSVEVIVQRGGILIVGEIEYSEYCKRKTKTEADKIRKDLIECGYKSRLSRVDGHYVVWWAK